MSGISERFEKAKAELKAESDAMTQKVKDEIVQSKRKALSRV